MTRRTSICMAMALALCCSSCALFESPEEFEVGDAGMDASTKLDSGEPADATVADSGDVGLSDGGVDLAIADAADMPPDMETATDAGQDGGEKDAGPVTLVPFGQQPAGHTVIAETDFANVPGSPSFSSTVGYWDLQPSYPQDDLETATDSGAFISGPEALRVTMPAGQRVNDRSWWIEAWRDDLPMTDEVYLSMAIKLEGTDWENDASGVMLAFFSYSRVPSPRSERRIHIELAPRSDRASEFEILARVADWPGGQTLTRIEQNLDSTPRVTVGEWHQLEMTAKLNAVGAADGEIDVWVDGYHVISLSTLEYRIVDAPGDFFYFLFFNEWNGPGTARDSEDTFLLDHTRLTGRF